MAATVHADIRIVAHHVSARVVVGYASTAFAVLTKRTFQGRAVGLVGHALAHFTVLGVFALDVLA